MGRKLQSQDGFPAHPMLRDKIGATITAKMIGSRLAKTQYGEKPVFNVSVIDADCDFQKDGLPYEPAEGEIVEIMAPTVLAKQLAQVKAGETFKTTYKGLGKKGKGNAPHLFDSEVL
jgi:hypothetical protein